jgi:hypothetical protein
VHGPLRSRRRSCRSHNEGKHRSFRRNHPIVP